MGSRACWIDPEELASLGAELTGTERSPELEAEESVPLDLFGEPVGERSAPPSGGGMRTDQTAAQRVGERLAEIRRRAESSGLLRSSPNAGAAEDGVDVGPAPGEGDSFRWEIKAMEVRKSHAQQSVGVGIGLWRGDLDLNLYRVVATPKGPWRHHRIAHPHPPVDHIADDPGDDGWDQVAAGTAKRQDRNAALEHDRWCAEPAGYDPPVRCDRPR